MVQVHTSAGTRSSKRTVDVQTLRKNVREALKRADLDIDKRNIPGERSGDKAVGPLRGKLFSYQVSGDRVADSTARYYMGTRLQKLSEKLDVHIELRRVRRNASEVFVDVFLSEEDAEAARHAEDLRKAEHPSSPAAGYYYRSKSRRAAGQATA